MPRYQEKNQGERRSQQRIGERQLVRFFTPDSGRAHEGVWVNRSDGGAFIETNDTQPLLTLIRIEAAEVVCQARVCRVHWLRPDERSHRSSGMAVKLISIQQPAAMTQIEGTDGMALLMRSALQSS